MENHIKTANFEKHHKKYNSLIKKTPHISHMEKQTDIL